MISENTRSIYARFFSFCRYFCPRRRDVAVIIFFFFFVIRLTGIVRIVRRFATTINCLFSINAAVLSKLQRGWSDVSDIAFSSPKSEKIEYFSYEYILNISKIYNYVQVAGSELKDVFAFSENRSHH